MDGSSLVHKHAQSTATRAMQKAIRIGWIRSRCVELIDEGTERQEEDI